MTFEALQAYYLTGYNFHKQTGISATSYSNWKKTGLVPTFSQLRIEKLTNGELKAEWE